MRPEPVNFGLTAIGEEVTNIKSLSEGSSFCLTFGKGTGDETTMSSEKGDETTMSSSEKGDEMTMSSSEGSSFCLTVGAGTGDKSTKMISLFEGLSTLVKVVFFASGGHGESQWNSILSRLL